jgi:hypothetical protein
VYRNKNNVEHTLTIGLALQNTVANSAASEDIDNIRANAPAIYYTQNRMITAEDYNLAPLLGSQNIVKIKAVNRTSSGISRNFDILDATGKYSSVNVFGSDGYIYKQQDESVLSFKFTNRIDIINFIRRTLEPVFTDSGVYNFYFTKFDKILFTDTNTVWQSVSTATSTGYFKNIIDNSQLPVGVYSTSNLKYVLTNAAVKFTAPTGSRFKKGKLVPTDVNDADQTDYLWAKIIKVTGDGTYIKGLGPILLNIVVPTGAIASRILPRFINDLPVALETEIVNQIFENQNFGLRYESTESQWKLVTSNNLNLVDDFILGKAGDTTSTNVDSSWIVAFVRQPDSYTVRIRRLGYVFGSVNQNRFYFDKNEKRYNDQIGAVVKDQIKVLGVNTGKDFVTQLVQDFAFEISDTLKFDDGYESTSEIKLSFRDSDDDGVIDNPESFENIVGVDTDLNFLFFRSSNDVYGSRIKTLVDNSADLILVRDKQDNIDLTDSLTYPDQQLIYFYDISENVIKRVNRTTNTLDIANEYSAEVGRRNLKFQYIHNASVDRRIDPSSSNIIDIFLLIRSYDESYRIYLAGGLDMEPVAPTSEALRTTFGSALSSIKSISDDIIYHPVKYKTLFGSKADPALQAIFKVVKNQNLSINDNDLKVRIISAINDFFDINNWDFGDRFYMGELTTYILNTVAPDLANIVIIPRQSSQAFGSLFEIQSSSDEILISAATVDDIEIVSAITASEIGVRTNTSMQSENMQITTYQANSSVPSSGGYQ